VYFFYYYPVGVDVPRPRIPWVTGLLTLVLVGAFTVTVPLDRMFALDWGRFVYRAAETSFLTPLTACFLHGGWLHLAGNLIYLWVFGPALEKALGRLGFLVVFCGTGYLGNLTQGAVTVHLHPEMAWNGVVGASGAISGLLGLFLLRFYYARLKLAYWAFLPLQGINRTGTTHLPAAVGLLLWVLLQVIFALVEQGKGTTAYGAHLGGLATGLILGAVLGQTRRGQTDRLLALAMRARDEGNAFRAAGLYGKYVEAVPWDPQAWLDYARALQVAGDWGKAQSIYRRSVDRYLREGAVESAIEVYLEARRGNGAFVLPATTQKQIAFRLEKTTRFSESIRAYLDFARVYPDHEDREHAFVRACTLMLTHVDDRMAGLELLDEALAEFPEGRWRGWLLRERDRLVGRRPRPLPATG